jgi:hypothetical protein
MPKFDYEKNDAQVGVENLIIDSDSHTSQLRSWVPWGQILSQDAQQQSLRPEYIGV